MAKIKNTLRGLYKISLRPYYWLHNTWPVWYYVLNRKSPKFNSTGLALDATQRRIVTELKANGCAISHLDELFPGQNYLPALKALADEYMVKADVKTKKTYLKQLFDLNPMVDLDNKFIQLAVNEKILDTVNGYFGLAARLTYFSLDLVEPVGDAPATMSQRWHRDPEDKIMCTVFLYLTDVGPENGPLHYVNDSHYGGRYGHIFPQKPPRGYYPPEGAVEQAIPAEAIQVFTCRAGSLAFFDTAGLHRGGYARAGQRLSFSARYISRAGYMDDRLRYPGDFKQQISQFSSTKKYALGR